MELAIEIASKRNESVPEMQDFEYMLHRNKPKLIRFRKYMKSVRKFTVKNEQRQMGGLLNRVASEEEQQTDEEDEEVYDSEKLRRMYRADRISQVLSQQKYEEYQKARAWSSNLRNKSEFLRKIVEILQLPKEIQENSLCLEIIQFLAHETVATIVDFAILTRLNSDNLSADPFIIQSNLSNDMLQLCPEVTLGRGSDGVRPIKVQEIQEAMRRVQLMQNQRTLGTSFRNIENSKIPFLAL
jgi:transcription initiation protein SPT3